MSRIPTMWTPERVELLRLLHQKHMTHKNIAMRINATFGTSVTADSISTTCCNLGLRNSIRWTFANQQRLRALASQGLHREEIAAEMGCTPASVHRAMYEMRIKSTAPRRKHGTAPLTEQRRLERNARHEARLNDIGISMSAEETARIRRFMALTQRIATLERWEQLQGKAA